MSRQNGNTKRFWESIKDLLLPFCMAVFFLGSYTMIKHFRNYTFEPTSLAADTVGNEEMLSVSREEIPAMESDEQTISDDAPYITDTRTVREYEGVIGVYDCFDRLLTVYDIDVSFLPYSDRAMLREGILFSSTGEACDFIESLDS